MTQDTLLTAPETMNFNGYQVNEDVQLIILHGLLSAGTPPVKALRQSLELAHKFMEQRDDTNS